MLLKGKTVVVAVCGGIAAYKALEVVSGLKKLGADVRVMMTKAAEEFVTPLSFQAISQNPVATNMFEEPKAWEIRHISLAEAADIMLVVPATANIIGKIANGIADDMVSTTVMACKAPKIIAPAMNTNMYENPITQYNIKKLKEYGYDVLKTESGRLACGSIGFGRLLPPEYIIKAVCHRALYKDRDLKGKRILVTAGPTRESIDPVRYITNHSSGKMGYSIAEAALNRGAEVVLISGNTNIKPPDTEFHSVTSAREMYEKVMEKSVECDIIIKAAAVADYRPLNVADNKIKKKDGEMKIELERTDDILAKLGELYGKSEKTLVGFCMETENLIENAKSKLKRKNLDYIVANSLNDKGAGFGTDTNVITVINKNGEMTKFGVLDKFVAANKIFDVILGYDV